MDFSTMAVVGCQWGDEGKGKIVDFLTEKADVVVRYQGGPNAGHTVVVKEDTFKLHHLPCGIISPGKSSVLGNGMVLDPLTFVRELDGLEQKGLSSKNLFISDRINIIMPYHKKIDELEEKSKQNHKLGTTLRGIGPAYGDKYMRQGIRMGEAVHETTFRSSLAQILPLKNKIFKGIYEIEGFTIEDIVREYMPALNRIAPFIIDTSVFLDEQVKNGSRILFEGAQGAMLDIDHGTYPYVTSSNTISGGACSGAGIALAKIKNITGVAKAYNTRVGEGPFPTEIHDDTADYIRKKGNEYGTTTGRPRRIGWLDGVALRHACRINGVDYLAITLFDVLSGLNKLYLSNSYRYKEQILEHFPSSLHVLQQCEPVYQEFKGWKEDISEAKSLTELPAAAKKYLKALEDITSSKISLVSVGPRRDQTIIV